MNIEVPIFIINRDRVGYLKKLLTWISRARDFEKKNFIDLLPIVIDNQSTYPPMIQYLREITGFARVVYFDGNRKMCSPWDSGMVDEYKAPYFVITDNDILPEDDCPLDAVSHFMEMMMRNKDLDKVGFGLRLDDVPKEHAKYEMIMNNEKDHWNHRFNKSYFFAPIDTTFAVWRYGLGYSIGACLRSDSPYIAKHLPWYEDENNLSEELKYYRDHADFSGTAGYSA